MSAHGRGTVSPIATSGPPVGRAEELRALEELFRGGARLVTLTGPVGVGKSRLALEFTARAAPRAVFPVDLADARDLDALCVAAAAALGVELLPGRRSDHAVAQIAHALASHGPALLLFDGADRALDAASRLAQHSLARAPALWVLVTTRERLRVSGEHVYEVAPLPWTPVVAGEPAPAVALLVERVRQVRRGYAPNESDAAALARIAEHLEGNPLAIELAARRLAAVGASAVLARLDRAFEALGEGASGGLRAALDECYGRLEPCEQAALAACASFRGGFGAEAAEAVVSAALPEGSPPALDLIQSLHEKSLLRVDAPRGSLSEQRLGMYLAVRAHVEAQPAARGSAGRLARAHAEYYAALGEALAAGTHGAGAAECLRALGLERENLLAVARRAFVVVGPGVDPAPGARALLALEPLATAGAPLEAYAALVDAALAPGVALDDAVRAQLMGVRAAIARVFGNAREARELFESAAALAAARGDGRGEGRLRRGLAFPLMLAGEFDRAEAECERALALLRAAGDEGYVGLTLAGLAMLSQRRGALDRARSQYEQALEVARALRNRVLEATLRVNVAMLSLAEGDVPGAREHCRRALELSAALGLGRAAAVLEVLRGLAEHLEGRADEALAAYRAGRERLAAVGFAQYEGIAAGYAAMALHEKGELEPARALHEAAIELLRGAGDLPNAGLHAALRGGCEADLGRLEPARRSLESAAGMIPAGDPDAAAVVQLQWVHFWLARAREAARRGEREEERALRERARRESAAAAGGTARAGFELRLALRVLAARAGDPVVRAEAEDAARAGRAGPQPATKLLVHAGGEWFQPPGGEPVSCRHRRPLRLLLARLAEQRVEAPGVAVRAEALVESAWPGERMLPESARSRLHVAVSTLRKMGLGDFLERNADGYLLRPSVPLRLVRD